jgi:hypothetical protein
MKTKLTTLVGAVLSLFLLSLDARAAIQVYDLQADWSDTDNPNGAWTYTTILGDLINDPFPWGLFGGEFGVEVAITKINEASVVPGALEVGDISILARGGIGVIIRWTAPVTGTINISGGIWKGNPDPSFCSNGEWTLNQNGNALSAGTWDGILLRSSPKSFSAGSAGANGLENIVVQAGDQVELGLVDLNLCGPDVPIGLNFTITLTSNSVDPVAAIENLALTVIQMNLQNGISNSLDSKLDTAITALIDVNVNNDGAACISLTAFINAVEAQRAKKITNTQADQLIASAQQIKATLNCGN